MLHAPGTLKIFADPLGTVAENSETFWPTRVGGLSESF